MAGLCKDDMMQRLPLCAQGYTVRQWIRADIDILAQWPGYPFPYEAFDFAYGEMDKAQRDSVFEARQRDTASVALVVDHPHQSGIGYVAPHSIDWAGATVGNFGLRIHPAWCNKGVGTLVLREVTTWCFNSSLRVLRLDVAASNLRAIRCYEKVGFVKVGETWRQAPDLVDADLAAARYDFLRPHVRTDKPIPELRFWLMEFVEHGVAGFRGNAQSNADKGRCYV